MRLRSLLILGIAAAALPPLLLLGFAATEVATDAITERVVQVHAQKADNLATFVDTWVTGRVQAISMLRDAFPLEDLSDEGRVGFQRLVYNQYAGINVVSLVNQEGADIAPSQMVRSAAAATAPAGHEAVSSRRFHAFRSALPLEQARLASVAVGRPYLPPDAGFPVVPVLFGGTGDASPILAVELSLEPLVDRLAHLASDTTEVAMLDADGAPFTRSGDELVRQEHFNWFLDGVPAAELKYALADGSDVLAAFSKVDSTGWLAVVAEPYALSTAPGRDIRLRATWFGLVAFCLAAVLGLHFAGKIHGPVVQLRDAAKRVGAGRLGHVVEPDPIRELGELGEAFNTMSCQLKEHADRIQTQQEEIHAFNLELQQRVEERTLELREAQAQLVESGQLAAVAELGAGLAHELNNPLAGILGLTQLLVRKNPRGADAELLQSIETQVVRCTEIVRSLLAFTREGIDRGDLDVVDLDGIVAEVTALVRPAFKQRGVQLEHQPAAAELPVRADHARLGRALTQLLTSLRALLPEQGILQVHGSLAGGEIRLELSMSGALEHAGEASSDDWFASGMSLWVARRILAEHGGRLVEPPPGTPSVFLLVLPKA